MNGTKFQRISRELAMGTFIGAIIPIAVITVAAMSGALYFIFPPLAVIPPGISAIAIGWSVVRWLNDRDDPRHTKRPPDRRDCEQPERSRESKAAGEFNL